MKILVTGCNGQLGTELMHTLEKRVPGFVIGTSHRELDVTDANAVERFLKVGEFSHVVNCAAYTAVDKAEEEKLECSKVNVDAIMNIAKFAEELDFRLLHISTDYVFDGHSYRPYNESDKPAPLSVYGTTKRKGETAMLGLAPDGIIIRTGWLYSPYGSNFVKTVLRLAREEKKIRVVCDQIGTPTYSGDLAETIADIVCGSRWQAGIYNYSNEGVASWYDFTVAILECAGMHEAARNIVPIPTEDYPTAATRPIYSVLDKRKIKATYGIDIPHWQDALRRCMTKLN